MKQEILNKETYNVKINNFEGPLELLLFLISKHKMDVFEEWRCALFCTSLLL